MGNANLKVKFNAHASMYMYLSRLLYKYIVLFLRLARSLNSASY